MADLRCNVIDTNPTTIALTGNSSVLVRYYSTAKVTMYNAETGGDPINLDTCVIKNGSQRELGYEATFENVESDTFELSAEDSEGDYVRKTVIWDMVDYIKLTCNTTIAKTDASGIATLQCVGNFFNGSFGAVSNTLSVQYRYRANGGSWSSWNSMSVSKSGNTYSATASRSGLDYEAVYEFEFLAKDRLMEANPSTGNVASLPVFHWGASDVTFEVPAKFNKGINGTKVNGNLQFGDDFCYITNTNGQLHLISNNGLLHNGQSVAFAEYGVWYPQLTCTGVYLSYSGWYSKAGNVVTVGFYIKAYTDSAYNGQDVAITGLPYIPVIAAAGGGMCSQAKVSAGLNFQCFVAETSGQIKTRVQPCNNTSDGLLNTSASGCKYDSAGTLTLSGTITYMTN